jgi:PAP2 superfamily
MASGVQIETASGELVLPALPMRPAVEEVSAAARTRWWVEALVVVWLCWVYDAINNLAPLRVHAALAHGRAVLSLERSLGLDPEVALNRWLAGHHTLGLLLSDYYDNAHFVVTLGLLGWLWYRRADIYAPLRNVLVAINAIGFAVFWLYPTAPPRLLSGSGFTDVVASTGAFGGWHTGSLAVVANQFAAMPSLHMAWAVWCSLVIWAMTKRDSVSGGPGSPASSRLRHPRWWARVAAVAYPFVTCVAVLATGNHYLLDVLAGVATAVLAVVLVGAVEAAWRARGASRAAA